MSHAPCPNARRRIRSARPPGRSGARPAGLRPLFRAGHGSGELPRALSRDTGAPRDSAAESAVHPATRHRDKQRPGPRRTARRPQGRTTMISDDIIAKANATATAALRAEYDALGETLDRRGIDIAAIKDKVAGYGVAVPCWGVGTGGTRFRPLPRPGRAARHLRQDGRLRRDPSPDRRHALRSRCTSPGTMPTRPGSRPRPRRPAWASTR